MEEKYIKHAIELSQESGIDGYPVGALIVHNNEIIATGLSNGKNLCDATSHAEIAAIREASRILQKRNLKDTVLYTSLEPCVMCFMACFWAYIPKIVYVCSREKAPHYYEGIHSIKELNETCRRKTELVHAVTFEGLAYKVIADWDAADL